MRSWTGWSGEFASIVLPSVAVTGGEPFAAMRALRRVIAGRRGAGIDISKLTSNGGGSEKRCGPTFDALEEAGWLGNRLFVPLLMLSVGEQTVPCPTWRGSSASSCTGTAIGRSTWASPAWPTRRPAGTGSTT